MTTTKNVPAHVKVTRAKVGEYHVERKDGRAGVTVKATSKVSAYHKARRSPDGFVLAKNV